MSSELGFKPTYLRRSIEEISKTPFMLQELSLHAGMELENCRIKQPHKTTWPALQRYAQTIGAQINAIIQESENDLDSAYAKNIIYPIFRPMLYAPESSFVKQDKDAEILKKCFKNNKLSAELMLYLNITSRKSFAKECILPSMVKLEELLSNMGKHPEHYAEKKLKTTISLLCSISEEYAIISENIQ